MKNVTEVNSEVHIDTNFITQDNFFLINQFCFYEILGVPKAFETI